MASSSCCNARQSRSALLVADRSAARTVRVSVSLSPSTAPRRVSFARRRSRSATNCRSTALLSSPAPGSATIRFVSVLLKVADGCVARYDCLAERKLLPIQPGLQLGIVGFQLVQPANVGTVGSADEVRQHVHLAERLADDGLRCARVREGGPISAGDIATPHGIAPCNTNFVLRVRFGELVDRQPMALIERLVQQLGRLVMMAGDAHCGAVQFVVRAIRRCDAKLFQDLPHIASGQAGTNDGAVQIGIEVPDLGTTCRTGGGCGRLRLAAPGLAVRPQR